MTKRRVLFVNWQSMNGAAQGKRKLILRPNIRGAFSCPITLCLHADYKTARGLRKHIDSKHSWYYYFEQQPEIKREEIEEIQPPYKRSSTFGKPHYSMEEGIGYDFLLWLGTSCGAGKTEREAKQSAKRALKFLMECTGDNEDGAVLSFELIDCCLGSPSIIMKFLTTLEKEWKLSYSGSLNYIHSINDLLDFRKSTGITDSNLRVFTVTEVYLRRAKVNFSKRKRLECTRNFDLETLIARESWATLEEMERVIPYHIDKFKNIIEKCKSQTPLPSRQELCFCTRFVTTYLFLRVKCSRPMTFQFLTLEMIKKAKTNNGFIDQREFKTAERYLFDTLIITEEVLTIVNVYIDHARPLLNPKCDYLLISNTGNQYQSLTTAMTLLVHQAIGKYIHPTRYRQIVETSSAERLTREEQEVISEDQKHSSTVAKIHYKKRQSRAIAIQGRQCMEKMIGETRKESNNNISSILEELKNLNKNFDNSVMKKSADIIQQGGISEGNETSPYQPMENSCAAGNLEEEGTKSKNIRTSPYKSIPYPSSNKNAADDVLLMATKQLLLTGSPETLNIETSTSPLNNSCSSEDCQFVVSSNNTFDKPERNFTFSKEEITKSIKVKKEEAAVYVKQQNPRNVKFSVEEDEFLKQGLRRYGKGHWASILKDKEFTFHSTRTRDSLRMRADSAKFKRQLQNEIHEIID